MVDATPHRRTCAGAWRARAHVLAFGAALGALAGAPAMAAADPARLPPHAPLAAASSVDAGAGLGARYDILVDSVLHHGKLTQYELETWRRGAPAAELQVVLAECGRRLRGTVPEDTPAGTRVPLKPAAEGREARELATACALPEGPRRRWFAALVASADGVLLAPRPRTLDCDELVVAVGRERRHARVILDDVDVTVLRLDGGLPHGAAPVALEALATQDGRRPVTVMGVDGTAPRVGAAMAAPRGDRDAGWPALESRDADALPEGAAWDRRGVVVGIASDLSERLGGHTLTRMVPAALLRQRLAEAGVRELPAPASLAPDAAMRRMLAATLPMTCLRQRPPAAAPQASAPTGATTR